MSGGLTLALRIRSRCFYADLPRPTPALRGTWRLKVPAGRHNTTTAAPTAAVHAASDDGLRRKSPPSASAGEGRGSKFSRNTMMRQAFREQSPEIEEMVAKKLASPYVPSAREYPTESANKQWLAHTRRAARRQVAHDLIAQRVQLYAADDWQKVLQLLTTMTPKRSEEPSMAAIRIILPKTLDIDMSSEKLEYVQSGTGLAARLRMTSDQQNPSAILLRGRSDVIAKAADEIVASRRDVEVYKLGELAALDYRTKQLWPSIDDSPDGGAMVPAGQFGSIWAHKEKQSYWIDRPYEDVNERRTEWTRESFSEYIDGLICGKLRPELARPLYRHTVENVRHLDPDGIRISLIQQALEDPKARAHITPSAFKKAVSFIAQRGGHRAIAESLIKEAQQWGVPMDADVLNVMLHGYVATHDVRRFHTFLQKMWLACFHANTGTWLQFAKLLQKDDEKKQLVVNMYDLGLFDDAFTRGRLAPVMSRHDAYQAFKMGQGVAELFAAQVTRYGEDWFTDEGRQDILREMLLFRKDSGPVADRQLEDLQILLERPSEFGRAATISSFNILLEHASKSGDWDLALWALSQMHRLGLEPASKTYQHLLSLAVSTHSPQAFTVAFFYGVLQRKLGHAPRTMAQSILLGYTPGFRPRVLERGLARALQEDKVRVARRAVTVVDKVMIEKYGDYRPVENLAEALERVRPRAADTGAGRASSSSSSSSAAADVTLKLQSTRDPSLQHDVVLSRPFRPDKMVEHWRVTKPAGDAHTTPGHNNGSQEGGDDAGLASELRDASEDTGRDSST